jgi:hypothetical protein
MKPDFIKSIKHKKDFCMEVIFKDGYAGVLDMKPYLIYEAFKPLNDPAEFLKMYNGGYYVEWECGADLSADTIRQKISIKETSLK